RPPPLAGRQVAPLDAPPPALRRGLVLAERAVQEPDRQVAGAPPDGRQRLAPAQAEAGAQPGDVLLLEAEAGQHPVALAPGLAGLCLAPLARLVLRPAGAAAGQRVHLVPLDLVG